MSQKKSQKRSRTSVDRKKEYRDLLDHAEQLQLTEEMGHCTTQSIGDILQRANHLFEDGDIKERTKHTDEVLLDAKVVATASNILLQVTDAISCEVNEYDPIELARNIKTKLHVVENGTDAEWNDFHGMCKSLLKPPPKYKTLYGPLADTNTADKPVKERKTRTKKAAQVNALKEPEKITNTQKEEDSVDDTVKFLYWALNSEFQENGGAPLLYLLVAIDPDNYRVTIENMFHLTFLVRDGKAKIFIDEDDNVYIEPMTSQEVKRAKKMPNKQTITSIDYNEWKEAIQNYDIKSPFLNKWKLKWDKKKRESARK